MSDQIEELARKRFELLHNIYKSADRRTGTLVDIYKLGTELGLSEYDTDGLVDYLSGEQLIKRETLDGLISITHYGVVEVEKALAFPDKPSTYFPPINYIHVEQMIGSQIQQGTNQSSQILTSSANDFEAIRKFVFDLNDQLVKLKLDAETQAEAESDITTIESQIKSPHPKSTIINECLTSLRTILEGAAGSVIATLFLQQIATLIK
jgi:hypothetical protein